MVHNLMNYSQKMYCMKDRKYCKKITFNHVKCQYKCVAFFKCLCNIDTFFFRGNALNTKSIGNKKLFK